MRETVKIVGQPTGGLYLFAQQLAQGSKQVRPQHAQRKVVGAELAPASLLRGQDTEQSEVFLIRRKQIHPARQRKGVAARWAIFQRRRVGQHLLFVNTDRGAGEHGDVLAQQFLYFLQVHAWRRLADHAQASTRL